MLDAELPDGDLTQIVHAIQNALRPNPAIQSRAAAAPALSASVQAPHIEDMPPIVDEQEISDKSLLLNQRDRSGLQNHAKLQA